jgi:hypothetical protein
MAKTTPAMITGLTARVGAPPRPDGYRPLTDAIWVWGRILGFPPDYQLRLFLAAGWRLDSGHRQIERVRAALDRLPPLGSPAGRTAAHDIVGDADLAVIAIDKALDIACCLSGRYKVRASLPKTLIEHRPLLASLRDDYAHIDERALGRIRDRKDPEAADAFGGPALIGNRVLTDGRASISIDADMTALLIDVRRYLALAWADLVDPRS